MIQITLLDDKNMILSFRNFIPSEIRELQEYVIGSLKRKDVHKIEIKKWER